MLENSSRKILIGLITGTLLSAASFSAMAASENPTHYLIDSEEKAVLTTRDKECVKTPVTPNDPSKPFDNCGDSAGDRDGDGVPDDIDNCPDNTPEEISKGVYGDKNHPGDFGTKTGCPIDTDGDGVPDYRDKCPNNTPLEISKGVDSDGCPLDSDGDGVPDYRDLCPGTPRGATVDENGCEYVTKGCDFILASDVTFGFDKYDLTPQGRDTVAALAARIMKSLPSIESIVVIGHTDSIGTDAYNQTLSEKRANTVADFLVSSGVPAAKVFSEGRGESEPIDDNSTKEGRAKNRRVQITIGQGKDCSGAAKKASGRLTPRTGVMPIPEPVIKAAPKRTTTKKATTKKTTKKPAAKKTTKKPAAKKKK
jgi:OOP family OmpA-OmpF porin